MAMLMSTMPTPLYQTIGQIPYRCEEIIPVEPLAQQPCPNQNILQPILDQSPVFADIESTDVSPPNGYTFKKRIGKGGFGKVYLAKKNQDYWAVKTVLNQNSESHAKIFTTECDLLNKLSHPNIITCLGLIKATDGISSTLYLFMEFMDQGSLRELCNRVGCISESHAKYITREILCGIWYLHFKGIVHRDIKADNIVIDSFGRVKISDFGITKQPYFCGGVFGLQTQMIGTQSHMAPEIRGLGFPTALYGFPADIWSLACTVMEILTGLPPQSGNYFESIVVGQQLGICYIDAYRPTFSSDTCWLFIKYALNPDQSCRPSAPLLLWHPWILMMNI